MIAHNEVFFCILNELYSDKTASFLERSLNDASVNQPLMCMIIKTLKLIAFENDSYFS